MRTIGRIGLANLFIILSLAACGGGKETPPESSGIASAPEGVKFAKLSPEGLYGAAKFVFSKENDPNKQINGDEMGLSFFIAFNPDGSLTAIAQSPEDPPESAKFTGKWEQKDSNLNFSFSQDPAKGSYQFGGILSTNANGLPQIFGKQTGGDAINVGNPNSEKYLVTTLELQQIPETTLAAKDIAGTYNIQKFVFIDNNDSEQSYPGIDNALSSTIIFEENGKLNIRFKPNDLSAEKAFLKGSFTINDPFHIVMTPDGDSGQTIVMRYFSKDGSITLYGYDGKYKVDPATEISATAYISAKK